MYGDYPYTHHLEAVAALAKKHNAPKAVVVAAWLHDVVEDTDVTELEVESRFGTEVAKLVAAVTKTAGSRKTRANATFNKIKSSGTNAVLLKLLDRLANVSSATGKLLRMYKEEWPLFYELLHTEGEHELLWTKLVGYMEN